MSKKTDNLLKQLIMMIMEKNCLLEFCPPTESPQEIFGGFVANERKIYIYKDRNSNVTTSTLFVLAHEYHHLCQYSEMKFAHHWLFQLGCSKSTPPSVLEAMEKEADDFACQFLKEAGISIPKRFLPHT